MLTTRSEHSFKICLLDIEKRLIPHAYTLKARLENNEPLTEADLDFLLQFQKAIQNLHSIDAKLPEHHVAVGNLIQLYSSLVSMATQSSSLK